MGRSSQKSTIRVASSPQSSLPINRTISNAPSCFHVLLDPNAKASQDKKTSKNQAPTIAGGVLAAAFIIALILVIAYMIYRKKKQTTIPYDKQILYSDDTVDF